MISYVQNIKWLICIASFIMGLSIKVLKAQDIDKNGVLRINKDTFDLKHNIKLAAKAQFYFEWGDKEYMELHSNKQIYRMKNGLEDGLYVATYDKIKSFKHTIRDTALVVTIKDGEVHGLMQRWDQDDKLIAEECEYKNGLMHGVRKLYFFDQNGNKYTNIEIFEEGLPVEILQMEW